MAEIGEVLPTRSFPLAHGSGRLRWRDSNHTTVICFPHHGACQACRDWVAELDPDQRLGDWGGRLAVVVDEHPHSGAAADLGPHATAVTDPGNAGRQAAAVPPGTAGVLIVDRFGQVFGSWSDPDGHRLPDAEVVLEEVRFIGVQCPECEVPDVPPGLPGEDATSQSAYHGDLP